MRLFRTRIAGELRSLDAFIRSRAERFSPAVVRTAGRLVEAVRRQGDAALVSATLRYDRVRLKRGRIRVPAGELRRAWIAVSAADRAAMRMAWGNIVRFHRAQRERGFSLRTQYGRLGQVARPVRRVGIHVPGGTAPLVSTLLMVAGAAVAAGVREIAVFSPPRQKGRVAPSILAAAWMVGVREVYAIGGAQGVAAMVYGTKSVRAVDKVAGPGNPWVQAAKWLTQAGAGCEGPSELLVLADDTASPAAIACDMLAQSEHTGREYTVLVTPSRALVSRVLDELRCRLGDLPRSRQAASSLSRGGAVVLVRSLREGVEVADRFAAEHVEVMCRAAGRIAGQLWNAGTILVGRHTPTAAEDYAVGPNHTLPTSGTAVYASGLGTRDFTRLVSVTELTRRGLRKLAPAAARLARMEGLEGHARSVEVDRD